ncbi:MAG: hypothetical protein FWE53_01595 [Firmicutes bacterium]|nr:hypothetical protein [Bacillota bacterium]
MESEIKKSLPVNHKLILDNRKALSLTGITKMDSINETHCECSIGSQFLSVTGSGIHIVKLDVEQGVLELEGSIDGVRYSGERKSVLKRLFK